MTLLPCGFTDRGGKLIVPTLVVWVSATLRPFWRSFPTAVIYRTLRRRKTSWLRCSIFGRRAMLN